MNTPIGAPCPRAKCKGNIVKRKGAITKEEFLGCSNYPECGYTESIEREEE